MKITLSLLQLKKVLQSEPIKFPLSFRGENFTEKEFNELLDLLQTA